jgi:thiol-disulfide isomerase/thioredoxin
MKKLLAMLLLCSSAFAQKPATEKYNYNDFMLIEKVEDQEKYYKEMLSQEAPEKLNEKATNDFRGELAFAWLAKGNVERYKFYKSTNPKFNPRQFAYLTAAVEKLFDQKQEYHEVAEITAQLLDDLDQKKIADLVMRTSVLRELNAAANAKLGKIEIARQMIAKSSEGEANEIRNMRYFKDMKSNYLNRYAIVMLAAGQAQTALDTLVKAFENAESNPYMTATFSEAYKKVKGSDKGLDKYLNSLKESAYQHYYKELYPQYISTPQRMLTGTMVSQGKDKQTMTLFEAKKPVYEVSMERLNGEPVHFAAYKGKILAVDFWTTMCTPCVAAFAGFERVVADYKKAPFQMFVINLFEDSSTVKSYVAQKGIPLEVLRDEENVFYNVQGTPTKILFDTEGYIRFYSSGYAGSTDREYYKLKSMIEIIKSRSSEKNAASKAK